MGLTKAQRHNKMMDKVFNNYSRIRAERAEKIPSILPTVADYTYYLNRAASTFNISIDTARNRFGMYTYSQWEKLLGI